MSKIIESVSYKKEELKTLLEKLAPLIGIQKLHITLKSGEVIEGVLMEIGIDYLTILDNEFDVILPGENIASIRYSR